MPAPEKTSKTRAKAAPKKGAARAATSEVAPQPEAKTTDWRGLTLQLPPTLPGSLYFDLAELELDGGSDMASQVRLLRTLLGDQYPIVRQKISDDRVDMDDMDSVLEELLTAVFDAYGMGAGESSASQDS